MSYVQLDVDDLLDALVEGAMRRLPSPFVPGMPPDNEIRHACREAASEIVFAAIADRVRERLQLPDGRRDGSAEPASISASRKSR